MNECDSDSELEEFSATPPEVAEIAKQASLNLLPEKSREKYEQEFRLFMEWCQNKKVNSITENVVLAYFSEKSKVLKSSTLWSKYSMLRATLAVKRNVEIKYPKLIAFLKRQSAGYRAKKSQTLTRDDINKFLLEAPDETYLMMKVQNTIRL